MADLARLHALRALGSIRRIEREAAQSAVASAAEADRAAAADLDRAGAATQVAAVGWHACVASNTFDPERAREHARAVTGCLADEVAAETARDRAAEALGAARGDGAMADARCRGNDTLLRNMRKRIARKRDERALNGAADRVSYAWRRA